MRRKRQTSVQAMRRDRTARTTVFDLKAAVDENEVYEERLIFLKILRSSYYKQIEQGTIWQLTNSERLTHFPVTYQYFMALR
jgi:hypothetical protein